MHEFGLCEEIVAAIRRRAQGRRVAKATIRAGALHRVDEESFRQAFAWTTAGTEAEGAVLDIVAIPILTRCGECARETESAAIIPVCPGCGATSVEIVQGDELIVQSIQYAQ